jgi:hypothetical protein
MGDRTMNQIQTTTEAIEQLPWVNYVSDLRGEHEHRTHLIETNISAVDMEREIHQLENLGVTVETISGVGDYGQRIYISV